MSANHAARTLVGRDAELGALEDALAGAFEGRGALVLLSGEPGIGKTTLADEIAAIAGGRGADVLWGRAWEFGGAPAYWPWVQALRGLLRSTDPDGLLRDLGAGAAELAQLLPEIQERSPTVATRAATDDDGARFRLFDAVLQLLRSASAKRPLVLILDDLHAADASSILLLRFLGAGLAGARVLVVAAYRDSELPRDHPIRTAVADLARLQSTSRLRLRGLAAPQVAGIIRAVAGVEAEPALVATIRDATEGNPLFVGEIIQLLAAEGRLDPHGASDEPATLTIPESLRDAIERRIERLGDVTLKLLEPASVLGRDFALRPLALLSGLVEDDVLDRLEPAREAGILVEMRGGVGGFRFAHALTRDAIYQGLPAARRRRLHLQAGAVLERVHVADPEPHLAELAHHFLAGGDSEPGRAIEYARRAAERAIRQLAFEEGVRLFAAALDALERSPDETVRCDILLALGDGQARAGDPRARDTFEEAAEIARRRGLADRLARAALGFGGRFVWEASREDRRLVQLLGDALEARPEGDDPLRVRLTARLAAGPMRDQTDWRPRDELSQRAVEAARRLGDPATLAYALDGRYAAVWRPDNVAERISIATDLIAAAEAAGDRERTLQGHHYRCLARLEIGDIDGCRADADAQRRIAAELRQPSQLFYARTTDATLAALAGRYAEAESLIGDAQAEGARAEKAMAVIYRIIGLHAIRRLRGRLGEIAGDVATLVERFPTYIVLRCVRVDTLVRLGLADEARHQLAALAGNRFAVLPRNDEWAYGMALLAEAAVALGEHATCEAIDELLAEMAGRVAVSPPDACFGAVDRARGLLALALGRPEEARERFEAALSLDDRLGAPALGAESRLAFAGLLF
ncbi:MAG TPA: AAA family ATPase, partial [Candidatus Eisenbacteria bacterium]|nr:AAA family ATPase [Candidatus Eisenbacteria bacterium]